MKRYYIVNVDLLDEDDSDYLQNISNEKFINIAKKQGTVYTEKQFVTSFNKEEITSNLCYLRII